MDSDEEELKRYERELFGDEDEGNAVLDTERRRRESGDSQENDDNDRGSIKSEEEGDERAPSTQAPDGEDKDKEEKQKVKPKKHGPVKPILLREDVLCGKNGLMKIEDIFKDFKFEGKGREGQDLDRMLHKFEHWVHIMDPRYAFGQTLERIEFLGIKKKSVKTYVKKIRMGLVSSTDKDDNLLDLEDDISGDDEVTLEHENVGVHSTSPSPHQNIPVDEILSDDDDFPNDEELDILMETSASAQNDFQASGSPPSSSSPVPVESETPISRVEVDYSHYGDVDLDSD